MKIVASLTPQSNRVLTDRIALIRAGAQRALEQEVAKEITLTKQRIISSKTSPDGITWQPWSLNTIRLYRTIGNPGSLLYRTGALANSMKAEVTGLSAKITAFSAYGKYIQFGTRKMPARQFLGWSASRIAQIKQTILKESTK